MSRLVRLRPLNLRSVVTVALLLQVTQVATAAAQSATLPEIRSSAANRVPACVTPDRMMAFLAARNMKLAPKYADIATAYRDLGDAWQIRWDYAFFQMILETNYLMYRRGDGSSGDVGQVQNNFAGIGATGGGVPGDRFPDVRTGVLAHMQHLVAYAGEAVDQPVARRTREFQRDIIEVSRKLNRPVRYSDLARRWAVDRAYGRNIEIVAGLFRKVHCTGNTQADAAPTPPAPLQRNAAAATIAAPPANAPPAPARRDPSSPLVKTVWTRTAAVAPAPKPAGRRAAASSAEPMRGEGAGEAALPAAAAQPQPQSLPPVAARPPQVSEQPIPAGLKTFAAAAGRIVPADGAAPPARPQQALPMPCRIYSASYGGSRTLLVQGPAGGEVRLTALTVEPSTEAEMAESFIVNHAPGSAVIAAFDDRRDALHAAKRLCPSG